MSEPTPQSPLNWADVEELILRALSIQSELNRLLQAQDKLRPEDILQIKVALDLINKEALQLLDLSRDSWDFPAGLSAEPTSRDYHLWDLAQILRVANVDFLSITRTVARNHPDAKGSGHLDTKVICVLILRFSRYTHDCLNTFEDEVAETLPERIEREVERRIHQLRTSPIGPESRQLQRNFENTMGNFAVGQKKLWAEERQRMMQLFERELGGIQRASAKAQGMAEARWQAEKEGWLKEMAALKKRLDGTNDDEDSEVSWEMAEGAWLASAPSDQADEVAHVGQSCSEPQGTAASGVKPSSASGGSPTFGWGQSTHRSPTAPGPSSTPPADIPSNPAVEIQTAIDILGRVVAALYGDGEIRGR